MPELEIKHVELAYLLGDLKLIDTSFVRCIRDGYNEKRDIPEMIDIYDKLSKFFWNKKQ